MDVWHQITLPCFTSKIFHVFPDVKEPNIKIRGIIGQASGLLGFQVCWTRVSPKFDQGLSLTCSMVSMVSSLIHPKVGSWFSRTCRLFFLQSAGATENPSFSQVFSHFPGIPSTFPTPNPWTPVLWGPECHCGGIHCALLPAAGTNDPGSPHLVVIFEMIALSCSIHYQRFWTISIIEFHRISTEFNYDHPAACPLDTV